MLDTRSRPVGRRYSVRERNLIWSVRKCVAIAARDPLPYREQADVVSAVIALLRFLFDIVLAVVAPRAALVAENLILRQQLIVVRRQVKRPRWRRFDRCRKLDSPAKTREGSGYCNQEYLLPYGVGRGPRR